jgi:hypothetical protein
MSRQLSAATQSRPAGLNSSIVTDYRIKRFGHHEIMKIK